VIILDDHPKSQKKNTREAKTYRKKARLLLPFVHFRTYTQSEETANYNLWIKKIKLGHHIP
jgi:hypothetical protein